MVPLIERAKDFYAALTAERALHDPAVLLFRSYLVQQFQAAGFHAANEVDTANREGRTLALLIKDPNARASHQSAPAYADGYDASGPKFRKFRDTAKTTAVQSPVKPNAAPLKKLDISKGRNEAAPHLDNTPPTLPDNQPQNDPSTSTGEERAAGVVGGSLTAADIERIKGMQNSQVAAEYSREALIEYLDAHEIKYTPTAKPKQLAATLTQHLNAV